MSRSRAVADGVSVDPPDFRIDIAPFRHQKIGAIPGIIPGLKAAAMSLGLAALLAACVRPPPVLTIGAVPICRGCAPAYPALVLLPEPPPNIAVIYEQGFARGYQAGLGKSGQ